MGPKRPLDDTPKEGRGANTTFVQKHRMIEWLELKNGANFKLITGGGSTLMKSVVAGAKLKKTDAYDELAEHVNQRCGANWTIM
jgi:hypothetical protein